MYNVDSYVGIGVRAIAVLPVLLVFERTLVFVLYFFFLYDLLALYKAPAAVFAHCLAFLPLSSASWAVGIVFYLGPGDLGLGISRGKTGRPVIYLLYDSCHQHNGKYEEEE